MDLYELKTLYETRKKEIKARLDSFKNLSVEEQEKEFMFCLLTPQSNAQKCWQAVEEIAQLSNPDQEKIRGILSTKTRFHNNKAGYIIKAKEAWNKLNSTLLNPDVKALRNQLASSVKGYGLKEASHFLRNIGKSGNQIAILDRHILKHLKHHGIIAEADIKSTKDYLEKEQKYLDFAKSLSIPADELDLLIWSLENGELFK